MLISDPRNLPSAEQQADIVESIPHAEQELLGYEEDVRRLQERALLCRKRLDSMRAIVAPIRKIPTEILAVIFEECWEEEHHRLSTSFSPPGNSRSWMCVWSGETWHCPSALYGLVSA